MPDSITIVKRLDKGSPLTATEMDANLTNLSTGITTDWSKFQVCHNDSGTFKTDSGTLNGSALTDGTVTYEKLKNIFYEEDSSTDGNTISIDLNLTAEPPTGSIFFIKVNAANTGAVTLSVTTGNETTSGYIKKGTSSMEDLTSGDLVHNQVIAVAYAGNSVFHLISNLSLGDPGIAKIAIVDLDNSSHTSVTDTKQELATYQLASNSFTKIVVKATARIIQGYSDPTSSLTAQFWVGNTGMSPSYDIMRMQVPSGDTYNSSAATASLDVKYAPWQTFVTEFDGGQTETSNIYFYKIGEGIQYKAEVNLLEVYGVI